MDTLRAVDVVEPWLAQHQSLCLCLARGQTRGTSSCLQHGAPGAGLGGMGISSSETKGWNCKTTLESGCKPSSGIFSGVNKPLGTNPIVKFLGHLFFFFFLPFNSFGLDLLLSKGFLLHRSSSWGRQKPRIWDENLLAYFPDQQLNLGGKHDDCYKSESWGSLAEILQTCTERSKLWWYESF